ncbi:branched-chain amino acid ABC transporter permease [Aeromicrobium chenweiae]|uniref:Branched-chain amino acid ABC transporter permease n=1 Tax=Aeromicrobium chenweiae TaxID=2079793 RepID=A0A2S0WIZ9_9ACTN|nr:branched-chain amino acid ABC transporter permease [Aeromicrobium chenweiae]AWB91264.1 branched-chain amino acid ABC transporter permease [Aeromicrobium chenweiae]TGN31782.1 branched-chain amino acid ABC transporter permease [Aeromicrobium chenweiae]
MINEWVSDNETLLQTVMVYYIFGLSIQVVLRAGVFSLASAGMWAIAGYATAWMLDRDIAWPLAVAVSLVIVLVVSLLLAIALGRLSGLYLGMATIAFDLIIVSLAYTWESVTGGAIGLYGIPRDVTLLHAVLLAVVATVVVGLLQARAGGRALDALRTDATLASSVGINVPRARIYCIVLSGVLGGLSGAISPLIFGVLGPGDGGFTLVVLGLTIVVIGGSRSWIGAVVGAVIVTFLPEVLTFMDEWSSAVYGVLIVVMVIFAPQGLTSIVARLVRAATGRTRPRPGDGSQDPHQPEPTGDPVSVEERS